MKEFEYTFDKGLRTGLRKHLSNPRNEQALVECHNLMPTEAGLEGHKAVVDLNVDSYTWGGRGKMSEIYIPCEDAILHGGSPTTNYSEILINIGDDAPYQGIIRFKPSTMYPVLLSESITSVKMYLYLTEKVGSGAHTISAYRVWQNWVESQVTHNRYATGFDWNTAGCAAADDDGPEGGSYDRKSTAEATRSITSSTPGWYYWTITSLCKEWIAGTASEYGVLLKSNNASNNEYLRFLYSEYTIDTTKRPYLSITWS